MPSQPNASRRIRFGEFELDLRAGELRKRAARLRLQEQPFRVLALLVQDPGEVVTREELQRQLWPSDTFVDFEDGLNTAVKKLRDVLGDSADQPRFIETLPKRGYRFIYPVDGAGAAGPAEAVPGPAAWWRRHWTPSIGPLIAIVLFAGAIALNIGGLRDRIFRTSASGPIHSVAVMALKNNTGDSSQDYLVDGLTDALTTELAQVKSLRVPSVTTAMSHKGTNQNLPEIARELGVDAVVEGSVSRFGDHMQLTVQLVHAPSDTHLWAHFYDFEMRDLSGLAGRVARDVIHATKVEFSEQEGSRLARERTRNPEAYEAYMKARTVWWSKITEEGFWKSIEYYKLAIEKDPTFADAYSGIALSYMFLDQIYPTGGAKDKALLAAQKALELDPLLAEPHIILGRQQKREDPDAAEKELRLAIELEPNNSLAHLYYSAHLNETGRDEEALVEIRKAEQLDPVSAFVSANVLLRLNYLGRYEEMIEQGKKALELDPNFWLTYDWLAPAYRRLNRYDEAIRLWEKELTLPGAIRHHTLARLASCYVDVGRRDDAVKATKQIEEIAKDHDVEASALALPYAALGRKEEAIRILQKAQRENQPGWDIFFSWVRKYLADDPRFEQIRRARAGSKHPKAEPK